MGNLIIKDVDFNGSILKAVQDINGVIWVGVRWVCEGLGLTEGQRNRQLLNIKKDIVISKGISNLILPTDGGKQEVLCVELDFLPLWLAKISITPKMEKENPELVEKLVDYQLRVKDVLADAFLWKNKEEFAEPQTIKLQLPRIPSYDNQFKELNQKIDKLYSDMGKFVNFMIEWKQSFKSDEIISTPEDIMENISAVDAIYDCKAWKQKIYGLIDKLLSLSNEFTDTSDVMKYIYDYMRKNYGVVWEQETREYKERFNYEYIPKKIDIVYNNDTYKSIFESVLLDLFEKTSIEQSIICESSVEDVINPLIVKYSDMSKNGCATYRKVYRYMSEYYKVDWKNHITRFMRINETGKRPSKKELIITKPQLRKIFEKSVKEMMDMNS